MFFRPQSTGGWCSVIALSLQGKAISSMCSVGFLTFTLGILNKGNQRLMEITTDVPFYCITCTNVKSRICVFPVNAAMNQVGGIMRPELGTQEHFYLFVQVLTHHFKRVSGVISVTRLLFLRLEM